MAVIHMDDIVVGNVLDHVDVISFCSLVDYSFVYRCLRQARAAGGFIVTT